MDLVLYVGWCYQEHVRHIADNDSVVKTQLINTNFWTEGMIKSSLLYVQIYGYMVPYT
jgi:hypothetical protein